MHVMRQFDAAAALLAIAIGPTTAQASDLFAGPFGVGNTWNVYEVITDNPAHWAGANDIAGTLTDPLGMGLPGHLVTLANLEENDFVRGLADGSLFIGLTNREGVTPGAFEGQPGSPRDGWAWVIPEPFNFQNWVDGEPDDKKGMEDAVRLRSDGRWNDSAGGFGLNDPIVPPTFPGTSPQEPAEYHSYVVEYETNLPTAPNLPAMRESPPSPRFPFPFFPDPQTRLPGPDGTANGLGVLEVRNIGDVNNVRDINGAIANILSGQGTIFAGSIPTFDIHDPDNGSNPGSIAGLQQPILSDTPGTDDNNIQSVIKGTFVVPAGQGGDYTMNFRTNDGFAMRVLYTQPAANGAGGGALVQVPFFEIGDRGHIDIDGTTALQDLVASDSNTQAAIHLPAGSYDFEFAVFENEGVAFWEVSTQRGNVVDNTAAASWVVLGSGATLPDKIFRQAAKLTGTLKVTNGMDADSIDEVLFEFDNFTDQTDIAEYTEKHLILRDHNEICCGRPGEAYFDDAHQFPNSDEDAGNQDNFSSHIEGLMIVDDGDDTTGETLTLTFGLFANDRSAFSVMAQQFSAVGGDDRAELRDLRGDGTEWLVADFNTGNSHVFGLIELVEGVTYQFEGLHTESAGDAGYEIFVAAGDQLQSGFSTAFFPLSFEDLGESEILGNTGLALIDGPGIGPSGGDVSPFSADFNNDFTVDGDDFLLWQAAFGCDGDCAVDANDDDKTNGDDFLLWQAQFGMSAVVASAVPEPGTLGLAAIALLAGLGRNRKGNKKRAGRPDSFSRPACLGRAANRTSCLADCAVGRP